MNVFFYSNILVYPFLIFIKMLCYKDLYLYLYVTLVFSFHKSDNASFTFLCDILYQSMIHMGL